MLNNFHINVGLASFAGPGAWNDPDMLEVGNGMSAAENQSEFSLWAEMAAPLIAGTNLVSASPATLSVLTNRAVIAVDQDSLGQAGPRGLLVRRARRAGQAAGQRRRVGRLVQRDRVGGDHLHHSVRDRQDGIRPATC